MVYRVYVEKRPGLRHEAAVEATLPEAVCSAYAMMEKVSFENKYCRSDIGARAMEK